MLVARAQADPAAFAPLYDRYFDAIFGYCLRRLRDRETAADATAAVFAKALAALPRYRSGSFRSWLFAIAHNVVIDVARQRRPTVGLDAAAAIADAGLGPEDSAMAQDEWWAVDALLTRLTPDQRRVVELRLAGLTGREIAAALGQSLPAVKATQFRAYARLRRLMAPGGNGAHEGESA